MYAGNKKIQLMLVKGDRGLDGSGLNPNLLINPNFKINQRSVPYYKNGALDKYCVDRWYLPANSSYIVEAIPTENGLKINKGQSTNYGAYSLAQYIEDFESLKGKSLTVTMYFKNCTGSFMVGINDGVANTFSMSTAEASGYVTVTHTVSNDATQLRVIIKDNTTSMCSITVTDCKLEMGDKATGFSVPTYAEEFVKCLMYGRLAKHTDTPLTDRLDFGIPMRTNPTNETVTIDGTNYTFYDAEIY